MKKPIRVIYLRERFEYVEVRNERVPMFSPFAFEKRHSGTVFDWITDKLAYGWCYVAAGGQLPVFKKASLPKGVRICIEAGSPVLIFGA